METILLCAKDKNPNLSSAMVEMPSDWNRSPESDNLPATATSRCQDFSGGEDFVILDVDGDDGPEDWTSDHDAIAAICEHSGRLPHGRENSS
jgi:hypothetical protein